MFVNLKEIIILMVVFLGLSSTLSCVKPQAKPENQRAQDRAEIHQALDQEASLKADRSELDKIRKNVPAEVQKTNDELALYLSLMDQGTEPPHMVRGKFTQLVQKRRTSFRQKVQRMREDFRAQETRGREDFLTKQRQTREQFLRKKKSNSDNRNFMSQLEKERTRFLSDQRDRRQNFEAELSAQSKDFDSYMREKQKEFNELYRLYSKKYSERPKDKKAVTGEANEFRRMEEMPTTPLEAE